MPSTPFRKPRHSLEAFDRLFERAFAPRAAAAGTLSPLSVVEDIDRPTAPSPPSPVTQFFSPVEAAFPITQQESLDAVWEEVRQSKAREMAELPSKVKSLESATAVAAAPAAAQPRKRVVKKRPSVTFREAPDGRNMTVTFDMTGVKKQDMHVSYRTRRITVSWRVERTTVEKKDDDGVVREREVRRYSHTIPLPEGTKFEDVRASRDGQKLTLTIPNSKCIRAEVVEDPETEIPDPQTMPDIDTALTGMSEYHSC